ncbi:hypothetical protein C9374_004517 [Naegleria lovaniensis]|uniref:Protein kinase domain-containing protein n=1 Tax=Naegleria lovaniensis TaxID=51637 RepID=A0AA88KL26_NAELO|nr:uncharacterized protein C9374_004517 [Naegleria lovaniensis]KAG2383180.1 hypothetical protein C9374_004517 [Naegleria lovaniensis]
MGNSNVSQKFASLQPVPLVDTDKRFKFWNLYDGVVQKSVQTDQRNVSVFEFNLTEKQARDLPKQFRQNNTASDSSEGDASVSSQNTNKPKNLSPFEEEPAKTIIECARKGMKFIKTLRHPSIIKYVDDLEISPAHFYIATEPVVPLRSILPNLEMSEILLGLHQIASALNFLNEQCQVTFNNLHLDSVYVTKDKQMRWMLGDFQFALEFNNLDKDIFEKTKEMRYSETITPEEGMKKFQKYTPTCRDVYAFEKLASKIFAEIEESCKKNNISNDLTYQHFLKLPAIKYWMGKALESEPQSRATFSSFLKLKIFEQDPLCSIMLFFDDMRLKKPSEKEAFFKDLKSHVSKLSLPVFKNRILPRMLTLPFVTEPASGTFLAHLFSPKESSKRGVEGILSGKDYEDHIITFIRKCYLSKNYSLRMRILQTLEYYQNQIAPQVAISEIIPEIMRGMKDSNNEIVMFTMNACVSFSKYLVSHDKSSIGLEIINNQFLPALHHYAVQNSIPKQAVTMDASNIESVIALRSHALLCLVEQWNIPGVHKGIILTALHANLFDKEIFELKVHALNVILIHMSRFDPRELMTYIMRPVLPLTLHEREQVRSKASQVLKVAIETLGEVDLSKCNLGMITSPNDGISNVTPLFPATSQKELVRHEIFTGQSPKHVIQFPNDTKDSETNVSSPSLSEPASSPKFQSSGSPLPHSIHHVESVKTTTLPPVRAGSSMKLPSSMTTATQDRVILNNNHPEKQEPSPSLKTHHNAESKEDEDWNSWSDNDEHTVTVETTSTKVIQSSPSHSIQSTESTSGTVKKKNVLRFDSDHLEEETLQNMEEDSEDLFKDFTPKEQTKPSSQKILKSATSKRATTSGNNKTKTTPVATSSPQQQQQQQQHEEESKESNLSKILSESEAPVDNSAWDEIDMFSQMDIKQ